MPSEWMKFKLKDKKDFFKGLKNGKIKKDQLLILFLLGVHCRQAQKSLKM